jgi:serine protease Do
MFTFSLNTLYNSPRLRQLAVITLIVVALAPAGAARANAASTQVVNPLVAASSSIEALVQRVSGSVVQVVVTGLHPVIDGTRSGDSAIGRGRSIGSGVVIDRGGYIITNAHVVSGAEQIDVIVSKSSGSGESPGGRTMSASIVGVAEEWDLALIKVDGDLTPLPLADYDRIRQGQLVFAFGSPDGLRNSVTMGMVSAVARQMEPDSPLVYVQTDAAINPGSSGGPLINAQGEVVGINTFIRSAAGGSDGLGFALPSNLVALAYPQLRQFGRLRRAVVGVATQTLTSVIAAGLHLPSSGGLIVSDVSENSPAAAAGIRIGDVITSIDGEDIEDAGPARLYLHLASLQAGRAVTLAGLRMATPFSVAVTPLEPARDDDRVEMLDSRSMAIEPLAILGVSYHVQDVSGVIVAARLDTPHAGDVALSVGDVILSINGATVDTVAVLRDAVEAVGRRQPVVLQVLQSGRRTYVAFERD